MKRKKISETLGLVLGLAIVLSGCGNDGGQTIRVGANNGQDRASMAKAQQQERERQARAADAKVNGRGPATTIRTGAARANSMQGSSVSLPKTTVSSSTSTSSASKQNNQTALMMAGLSIVALFGKDIMNKGGELLKGAKEELKSTLSSEPKAPAKNEQFPTSKLDDEMLTSVSGSKAAGDGVPTSNESGPKNVISKPLQQSAAEIDSKAKAAALALAQQCRSDQKDKLGEIDSFLGDVTEKVSTLGVKS